MLHIYLSYSQNIYGYLSAINKRLLCVYPHRLLLIPSLKYSMNCKKIWLGKNHAKWSNVTKIWNLDMFVWTSGFQNPLAHNQFNMFVDEWRVLTKDLIVEVYLVRRASEISLQIYWVLCLLLAFTKSVSWSPITILCFDQTMWSAWRWLGFLELHGQYYDNTNDLQSLVTRHSHLWPDKKSLSAVTDSTT